MKQEDIKVTDGQFVTVRFLAKDAWHAYRAYSYCSEFSPDGYIVRGCKITRRKKGGVKRFLHLQLEHTGNKEHPPVDDWKWWSEVLTPEGRIARGETVAPRPRVPAQ